jgi:hypothetical protein
MKPQQEGARFMLAANENRLIDPADSHAFERRDAIRRFDSRSPTRSEHLPRHKDRNEAESGKQDPSEQQS